MRNDYNIDTLTSADKCQTLKTGRKVIKTYEGVIYRENFKRSPFRKIINKLFTLGQKYKGERNDLMQCLANLLVNSLY